MNVEPVEVNYLFWSGFSPLILVILFSVLMGGLITATVGALKMFKIQKELKRLKKENVRMETILKENGLVKKDIELDETEIDRLKNSNLLPLPHSSIIVWSGVNVCYKIDQSGNM